MNTDDKDKKVRELEVENKAVKAGVIGIVLLASIFYIVEVLVLGVQNFSWYSIISLYCSVVYLYRGIKLTIKSDIIAGVIWTLATIACVANYILHRF